MNRPTSDLHRKRRIKIRKNAKSAKDSKNPNLFIFGITKTFAEWRR